MVSGGVHCGALWSSTGSPWLFFTHTRAPFSQEKVFKHFFGMDYLLMDSRLSNSFSTLSGLDYLWILISYFLILMYFYLLFNMHFDEYFMNFLWICSPTSSGTYLFALYSILFRCADIVSAAVSCLMNLCSLVSTFLFWHFCAIILFSFMCSTVSSCLKAILVNKARTMCAGCLNTSLCSEVYMLSVSLLGEPKENYAAVLCMCSIGVQLSWRKPYKQSQRS